ncbi:MAG: FprA family A-type flavoprotein [Bacteroidales bacterium]|nr:FprA family A-type flavoprotein [Bacteroidales bacterium]
MDNKVIKVKEDIYWIGILDEKLRTFDIIMETKYGTTYNSYFINADKKAVVETAKEKFWDTYKAKLEQVCNPSEISYIIVDHTEPDHAGSIKRLLELAPDAVVVGSNSAIKFLENQIGEAFKHRIVKEGDVIDLGNKKLRVISAPNLHWPDSIYTYLEEDKLLFTCDSFGAHFCHEAMFDDLTGNYEDAFTYYYDVILKPFSRFFLTAIDKIRPLAIDMICPGHGPILRKHWKRMVDLSEQYSKTYLANYPVANRILVAYVSAYGFTKTLAEKIAQGLQLHPGIEVDLCDIEQMDAGELADKIAKANAYLFGSPTINQNTLPQMYTCLSMINPIRDKGKLAGCFGSYGWTGETKDILIANFTTLKLNYFGEALFIKFKPQEKDFENYIHYGKAFGNTFIGKINSKVS